MDDDRLLASLRRIAEPVEPAPVFLDRLYESLASELGFHDEPAQTPVRWLGRRGRPRSRRMGVPLWLAAAVLLALAVLGGVAVVGALIEHRTAPDLLPYHGVWTTTGGLVEGHSDHTGTLLPDGRVLVVSGYSGNSELYDPATEMWLVAREMIDVRSGHSATLLPDGRVLVAGGQQGDAASEVALATAELYDPRTGTWTATGDLVEGRSRHTATLLPNGTVLIVGGNHGAGDDYARLSSAELYDPDTGTWTAAGEMNVRRTWHTATLLPDGTVLVAGGVEGFDEAWASSELYDPVSRTWTATGAMTVPRLAHTATLLPNGTVLVAGGDGGPEVASSTVLASAELYDPLSGTWASTATMTERRWVHTATLLQDGTVLVVGSGLLTADDSQPSATAELYDPSEGTWTATASLSVARLFHTATRLPDGTVLVAGGAAAQAQMSAEVYHPPQ